MNALTAIRRLLTSDKFNVIISHYVINNALLFYKLAIIT